MAQLAYPWQSGHFGPLQRQRQASWLGKETTKYLDVESRPSRIYNDNLSEEFPVGTQCVPVPLAVIAHAMVNGANVMSSGSPHSRYGHAIWQNLKMGTNLWRLSFMVQDLHSWDLSNSQCTNLPVFQEPPAMEDGATCWLRSRQV
ncbi:hypothetical protein VFPPC_16099 [Pochonia chlamydosporia 170]|uniref:Uncharacterized protein n=1 Tax=Pochonia chlamydosporia 170 TaxID=1380566 RepID=A0A179FP50_METCM|nr:hypothetical protein VFPPC_16099 [Pochonia chlamydosporia 170]OAQ67010.1 hypothetical protein VFPPC_16099 [Pochonia chlamydosporia 170]